MAALRKLGPAISEASIELECVDFAVRYKAPGEAEVDDLAGQNVPRGMATRKQRRVQMAKKCRAAARTRGTTREAARAHRLAADELADTCGQLAVTDGVRTWWEAAAEAAAEEAAAAEAAAEEAAAAAAAAAEAAAEEEFDLFVVPPDFRSPDTSTRDDSTRDD